MRSKIMVGFSMMILLLFSVSAYEITEFTNGLTEENLTFSDLEGIIRYVDLPLYSNVTTAEINLLTINYTSFLIFNETAEIYDNTTGWRSDENALRLYDANYSTGSYVDGAATAFLYSNLTKKDDAVSMIVGLKYDFSDSLYINATVPSSCFSFYSDKVSFSFESIATTEPNTGIKAFCWDGSWNEIISDTHPGSLFKWTYIWEEYYYQNVSGYSLLNISDNNVLFVPSKNSSVQSGSFVNELNNILSSCSCDGCTLSSNLCNIPFVFNLETNGTVEYSSLNLTYDYDFELNLCDRGATALNFTLFNESDDSIISGTIDGAFNYSVTNLIDGTVSKAFNFSVSSVTHEEVCIYPNGTNITSDFQILYSANGDQFNYFQQDLKLTNVTRNISLYVVDSTTQVLFNVKDTNGDNVVGALIEIQKYDVGSNTYKTTEIITTDNSGNAVGNIVLNTAFYRVFVTFEGSLKLTDAPTQFVSTARNYVINLQGTNLFDNFDSSNGIVHNLTFNNVTNNFRLTYSDPDLVSSRVCLRVQKTNISGNNVIGESCLSTQSGTILIAITDTNNTEYTGLAYAELLDGTEFILDTEVVSFETEYLIYDDDDSRSGVYVSWMLIATMFFLGIVFHPIIGLILSGLAIIVVKVAGFWYLSTESLIIIIVMIIISIWRINSTR